MSNKPIRVAVCDDHQVVLEGLKLIFSQVKGIDIAGMFHSPDSLLSFLQTTSIPVDVIVVDAHLGNNRNGVDLIHQVPHPKKYRWILFSSYVDKYLAYQAEKAGFAACLSKEVPASVLHSVLLTPANESFVAHPPVDADDQAKHNMEVVLNAINNLTKREREIMQTLLLGLSSKESADRLHISIYTFETHKKNIFRKLEINSTNELMRIAIDYKFIQ